MQSDCTTLVQVDAGIDIDEFDCTFFSLQPSARLKKSVKQVLNINSLHEHCLRTVFEKKKEEKKVINSIIPSRLIPSGSEKYVFNWANSSQITLPVKIISLSLTYRLLWSICIQISLA